MLSIDIQSTLLLMFTSSNWALVTSSYSTELLLNTYLLVLSYQDLLIDLSEVYGVMMFIFILISSSNTTNILMMGLPQNHPKTTSNTSQHSNYTNNTNLNYKSVNYSTWKSAKTAPGLLHLCDLRNTTTY
jgi:hypothetical protein